jgi:hypothetical protein
MSAAKPIASLSLDLDNLWSYMKTHGDKGWETFPSYLDLVVPRILQFLRERNLIITFFVVGQDAALAKNTKVLRSLVEAGHEIGNHSFHHEPWLHLYSEQQLEAEIAEAEEAITAATRAHPVGFRGPGFSLSQTTIDVLSRRGYLYDGSTLPTYIGPLARLYYFMTARLNAQEKQQRDALFGTVKDGMRPVQPYRWRTTAKAPAQVQAADLLTELSSQEGESQDSSLVEIPVTTMPLFKIPIHVSYIIYVGTYSRALALLYFRFALWLCHVTKTSPSLLLHPLDFLGCDDMQELSFFPAMNMRAEAKLKLVSEVLRLYTKRYNVVAMRRHAYELAESELPVRSY